MSGAEDADAVNGDSDLRAALGAIAGRVQVAQRLEPGVAEDLLRSIVEAAVALFDAEAASLALHDPASGRLVFRVAAGERGIPVLGREIDPGEGLVGHVYSSGQALAVSDVAGDARFGRAFAQSTGYLPRSIVAVPLIGDDGPIGVLEILDKRSQAAFSLRDVELAEAFARQAATAIRASRLERDTAALLRAALVRLAGPDAEGPAGGGPGSGSGEAIVAAAMDALEDADDTFWALVDRLATVRRADPGQLEMAVAVLDALARQRRRAGRGPATTGEAKGRAADGRA
jgi:signal transduction protein with GAF and PtsI domain